MQSYSLAEVRYRTYKPLDSWWTVLAVDPLASRLVRVVAPYRWVTPHRLTLLAAVLGAGAAASFAAGRLIAGALLFHLAFLVDCADGKLARLRGAGTLLGAWLGFLGHRLRALACAAALMGGLFSATGRPRYLWLLALIAAAEMLRYLNAGQMAQIRAALRQRSSTYGVRRAAALRAALRRRRIRLHVISGVEFEVAVFVAGPLTGWVTGSTLVAGALLVAFELCLIGRLARAVHRAGRARAAAPRSSVVVARVSPVVVGAGALPQGQPAR